MTLKEILQLGFAATPSIYKGLAGLFQSDEKVPDRTYVPPAFTESLARTRLAANTNRLPGQAQEENRILQGTAAVNAGAQRAGASSSDVLAALGASDAQQKWALAALGARGDAYQQQQQGILRQQEGQLAAYQQQGRQATEREQAALTEAGERNKFGAVDGLSQLAVYALGRGDGSSGSTPPMPNSSFAPPKRARHAASVYGLPVPDWARGLMG